MEYTSMDFSHNAGVLSLQGLKRGLFSYSAKKINVEHKCCRIYWVE